MLMALNTLKTIFRCVLEMKANECLVPTPHMICRACSSEEYGENQKLIYLVSHKVVR